MRFVLGIVVGAVLVYWLQDLQADEYKTHIESYQMGIKHALRLEPVSWELEETCLNLWMKKQ
jgi:hypothetical protein